MPSRTEVITPALLRDWPLPAGATSKYGRGQVVVIGGARSTPGAALLAGVAALRVGAGRLTMAVARSVSIPLAIELPEAGVVGLPETENGSPDGSGIELLAGDLQTADALLVGPGLDDPERTTDLLSSLGAMVPHKIPVLLDAFALGVLPRSPPSPSSSRADWSSLRIPRKHRACSGSTRSTSTRVLASRRSTTRSSRARGVSRQPTAPSGRCRPGSRGWPRRAAATSSPGHSSGSWLVERIRRRPPVGPPTCMRPPATGSPPASARSDTWRGNSRTNFPRCSTSSLRSHRSGSVWRDEACRAG